MSPASWRMPLHIPVAVLFSLLILGVGGTISLHHFSETRQLLATANERLFRRLALDTRNSLSQASQAVRRSFVLLTASALADTDDAAGRLPYLQELTGLLDADPLIESIMIGYGNGSLFLVERSQPDQAALDGERWHVLDAGPREGANTPRPATSYRFDRDLRLLSTAREDAARHEPRLQAWYRQAAASNAVEVTQPYRFEHSGRRGVTFARRNGSAVFAVNVDFAAISQLLAAQPLTPSTRIQLVDDSGALLAASGLAEAPSEAPPRVFPASNSDERQWLRWSAPVAGFGTQSWTLSVALPDDEIFAEAYRMRRRSIAFTVIAIIISFPLAWLLSLLLTRPLYRLADEARALSALQFQPQPDARSVILEVDQLASAMELMRAAIDRFLDMGHKLGSARDVDNILHQVETGARNVAGVGWSTVATDDSGIVHWQIDADSGPASGKASPRPPEGAILAPLLNAEGPASIRSRVADTTWHVLGLPLRTPEGDILGTLLLAGPEVASTTLSRAEVVSFLAALAGNAAVSLDNQRLLKGRKDLLQGVIRMVAEAIDAKSPYTGEHCRRVPEIALRLARAAHDARSGPLSNYRLVQSDWEALEIASWLHDYGKLTTPEYVIDKATKLETIYNRIHEIRTRFEVLKRDAEIDYWRAIVQGGDATLLRARRDLAWQTLDEEFAFVARCNHGSEHMPSDHQARLQRIARRRWWRTLDDRLGLSDAELVRCRDIAARALPAEEQLLQDRAEHIVERGESNHFGPGNPWGFQMIPPRHLYNHGELYSLRIAHGTLTEEERFKIKEHIVETIIMLSRLPFPSDLSEVPEMAGGHHETMDGAGYPRGLLREQMSVSARIMAIADIFEALTACDRPYKAAKSITESLAIMEDMCRRNVLDRDLFQLFVEQGLWKDLPVNEGKSSPKRATHPHAAPIEA